MNANDLAIQLDAASSEMEYNHVVSDWKLLSDSATMLRQQQAEIEALKGEVAYLKHINRNWAISEGLVLKEIEALKAKTLTDEEITDVYVECMLPYGEFDEHEFARAILRKTQEK